MAERKVVLLEQDDLMHPNTGESNYNESAYYNFYDRERHVGGFARLGNRANEGYAEMTVCFYLPDHTVGFMFGRPKIENNLAHDAGGLKFQVVKPFEHHRVTYQGKLCILKNPLEMADPAAAFKSNPYAKANLEIDYHATAPGWGGEMREKSGDAGSRSVTTATPRRSSPRAISSSLATRSAVWLSARLNIRSTDSGCAIIVGDRATGRRPNTIAGSR